MPEYPNSLAPVLGPTYGLDPSEATDDEVTAAIAAEVARADASYEPYNGLSGNLLTAGQETINRLDAWADTVPVVSGRLQLCFFTARKSETIASLRMSTGLTASGALTLAKMGLYSVAGNGDITLIGSTANDTSLFMGTYTNYTRALTAPVAVTKGSRYGFAYLLVGSSAATFAGAPWGGSNAEAATLPLMAAVLTGQTDLPASVAVGSLSGFGRFTYGVMLP